ncbi:SCL-interrupting locus protein homolog isoform X2 [Betta splendens]|uniref:SCL-interrupting locus protein homolog isoform X2 n=1 Tax=Betta splendens TaxID=158456 RepID=A0A6P7MBE1_BETSP|nr:SCL-interrupting locus protein homolog isoform X2 [Betta splendens]
MSLPVNLQALPSRVLHEVFSPETVRGRSALWDSSPAGDRLCLHLCSNRKPRLLLLEKALRLAQRHLRHNHKPQLYGFFLGSVSVDSDEEGITVNLDRFDPGRKQTSGTVPSAMLPGDILVPCLFTTQTQGMYDSVIQSDAELHHCFKALQQFLSGRQPLDLSQLLRFKGRVVCSQLSDGAAFCLSWSAVCPSVSLDVQPVRAIPIIPTALLRSLMNIDRPLRLTFSQQRGFLTMDQTRKLFLLLESDPKASTLPLVGLWLSGVTHIYNPQVWAWCLRFLYSFSLQERVLSESNCFLLVVFESTHRTPQFFQCRVPQVGPVPQLGYQLLTAFQSVTLYQVSSVDNLLQCELGSDGHSRQMEVFTAALCSFNSPPPAAGLSVSDQDSGVEDEDLSPRPSPRPHVAAQQTLQPSVPELSLLVDSSFTSKHLTNSHIPPPPADRKLATATRNTFTTTTTFSALSHASPHHLHSTPNSNLQQPCTSCSTQAYDCSPIFPSPGFHLADAPPSSFQSVHATPSGLNLRAAPPLHHQTPLIFSQSHLTSSDQALSTQGISTFSQISADPLSTCQLTPSSFKHFTPSLAHKPSAAFSTCHSIPPASTLLPPPVVEGSDPPPLQSFSPGDSLSPLCLQHPPCGNQCCHQAGGDAQPDTYQLLLHQDQQLRLLQSQVQMLLEAQRKLQSSSQQDTQAPRSMASIAVGTGASLFWAHSDQALPHEVQTPCPSSTPPPPSSSSTHELSVSNPVAEAEDDIIGPVDPCSVSRMHSISSLQSPVLGESVSMYRPVDEQQSFYHNLMTQLTSRLQEEMEDNKSDRTSLTVISDPSQACQMPSASRRKEWSSVEDPVVIATMRQLQQLGVDVEEEALTESNRNRVRTVQSSSTLACVNPAAVVSRLSISDMMVSSRLPGESVDLSLEANAIALRYLSDSQLSRLSLGCPNTRPALSFSSDSLLSPCNMSLATRKYLRKYGLIEEENENEQEMAKVQEASGRQPLTETLNVKFLPQSHLIRDLQPKLQLLVEDAKMNCGKDKENNSSRQTSLVKASSRQTEGSVGNLLDLSRLRQLPKLF